LLEKDPFLAIQNLDITVIVGAKDHYRLRIWTYRFLFIINEDEILISFFDAGSRGWIYKKLK
jgi:mRNA-degrading endonuclease RelE of RelBE toxin-antitoxin system